MINKSVIKDKYITLLINIHINNIQNVCHYEENIQKL